MMEKPMKLAKEFARGVGHTAAGVGLGFVVGAFFFKVPPAIIGCMALGAFLGARSAIKRARNALAEDTEGKLDDGEVSVPARAGGIAATASALAVSTALVFSGAGENPSANDVPMPPPDDRQSISAPINHP